MKIRVVVPASAGNTGSAFDTLGLAFGLHNEATLDTSVPAGVDAEGEGAELLRKGEPNFVLQAMERFAARTGRAVPAGRLSLVNRIPFGRGLGSSAAAIVAGMMLADAATGAKSGPEALLRHALSLENHPDNLAPAIYGGFVLTVLNDGEVGGPVTVVPFRAPADWRAVLYVPELVIPTKKARAILPPTVPRADAIYNHSRVGLLVAALAQGRPELLRVAMQDRLHQPYRAQIFPEMDAIMESALRAGAWGACLSGAGSAILGVSPAPKADAVAAAMREQAEGLRVPGRSLVLEIPVEGARVETLG
jgi:homoserine kinase